MSETLKKPSWTEGNAKPQDEALIQAARRSSAPDTSAAIERGANVNTKDENGMTALHHAAARGARGCVRVLVNSGQCDFLARDKDGRYAADLAIEGSHEYGIARLLLKKQAEQAARTASPAYIPHGKDLGADSGFVPAPDFTPSRGRGR